MSQKIRPAIAIRTTTPPTTPPAMAPVLLPLLLLELPPPPPPVPDAVGADDVVAGVVVAGIDELVDEVDVADAVVDELAVEVIYWS